MKRKLFSPMLFFEKGVLASKGKLSPLTPKPRREHLPTKEEMDKGIELLHQYGKPLTFEELMENPITDEDMELVDSMIGELEKRSKRYRSMSHTIVNTRFRVNNAELAFF